MNSNFKKNVAIFIILGTGLIAIFTLLSLANNNFGAIGLAAAIQSSALLFVSFGLGLIASAIVLTTSN